MCLYSQITAIKVSCVTSILQYICITICITMSRLCVAYCTSTFEGVTASHHTFNNKLVHLGVCFMQSQR